MSAVATAIPPSGPPATLRWCTIAPMPYFDDLFKRMSQDGILGLQVVYLRRGLKAYPMQDLSVAGYSSTSIESVSDTALLFFEALTRPDRLWLVGGWGSPKYVMLLMLLSLAGRRFWMFTDAPVPAGRVAAPWHRFVRKHLLSYWFAHAAGIIGTGKMAVARLRQMGAEPSKLVSIPYPLDESRFSCGPDRPVDATRPIVVVCSGRLHIADKRFDLAIKAFAHVRNAVGRDVQCRLRIAGAGPDEKALRHLVATLDVSSDVEFLGWLDQNQLSELYKTGDVYLHPTDFEPYGVTVVEALYSGLYTVASDGVGAAVELVQDGVNGTVFRNDDLPALCRALNNAIDCVRTGARSKADIRAASLRWCMDSYISEVRKVIR